jgi:peptidoglycan hydrolase-like protein with peptidoglycan-binding domain
VRPGARGPTVRVVQCLVTPAGRHPAKTSGRYDPATVRSVRAYQSRHGLRPTGVVDRGTWTSLLARGSTPFLRKGASGESVRRLQRALAVALPGSGVTVDGDFGPATSRAVRRYRAWLGLPDDDRVTERVWSALVRGGDRAGRRPLAGSPG